MTDQDFKFKWLEKPEEQDLYFNRRIRAFSNAVMDIENPHKETEKGKVIRINQLVLTGYRHENGGNFFVMNKDITLEIFKEYCEFLMPYVENNYVEWYLNQRSTLVYLGHLQYNFVKDKYPRGKPTDGHIVFEKHKEPQYPGQKPFYHPRLGETYYVSVFNKYGYSPDLDFTGKMTNLPPAEDFETMELGKVEGNDIDVVAKVNDHEFMGI